MRINAAAFNASSDLDEKIIVNGKSNFVIIIQAVIARKNIESQGVVIMNNKDLDFFFRLQDKSKEEFKEILSNYVYYRFENEPIEENVEEYKDNNDNYSKLYQQISQDLSEEKQKLLLELDFFVGSNLVITERIRYWQGFKDAYRLFAMLNS